MTLSDGQPALHIDALLNAELYPHPVEALQLIETHISWVILTGPYAYKIKKPVDLGFLDFSTLAKRHKYCDEELRLNRRTAPEIYLDVVPICGSLKQPHWDGQGEVVEYAVKMAQFPQDAQLDRLLQRGELTAAHMDAFAQMVADFHAHVAVADATSAYGEPAHILQPVEENFSQIRERIDGAAYLQVLDELERWSLEQYQRLQPQLQERKQAGFIRECHGDMHLRNLAWVDAKPIAFDGIEFNANLRWIDVISEVAFLVMDLQDRQQPGLAQRFINAYLEINGDYRGLRLLNFYLVYRALVRAKVAAIRLGQQGMKSQEQTTVEEEFSTYLTLAQNYTKQTAASLIITRGLSGSGKTTLTQPLLEKIGAIRIRSDVERKRLAGLKASESGHAAPGQGIYRQEFSDKTYHQLRTLAADIIDAGYSVIVDATFLDKRQRDLFQQLAVEKAVRFKILDFKASADTLRQRIRQRSGDASDADLQVLERQLANYRPLDASELAMTVSIDTERQQQLKPEWLS